MTEEQREKARESPTQKKLSGMTLMIWETRQINSAVGQFLSSSHSEATNSPFSQMKGKSSAQLRREMRAEREPSTPQ